VLVGADAIDAKQFPGHLKTGDLIAAVGGGKAGFEKTAAYRIQRLEAITAAEQAFTTLDLAAGVDQLVQALELFVAQPDRQAQLAQIAAGAGGFQVCQVDRRWSWV